MSAARAGGASLESLLASPSPSIAEALNRYWRLIRRPWAQNAGLGRAKTRQKRPSWALELTNHFFKPRAGRRSAA